jgi:hypothetical protein
MLQFGDKAAAGKKFWLMTATHRSAWLQADGRHNDPGARFEMRAVSPTTRERKAA